MGNHDKIAVLDFGGQYAHLIAERLRDNGFYADILPCETPPEELKDYKGIILSGGPKSVYDLDAPKPDMGIFSLGIPIMGICYGAQLMAKLFKGEVERTETREYGRSIIRILAKDELLSGLGDEETVWMSHGDSITCVPDEFDVLAKSYDDIIAAISNKKNRFYGIQFHPEVEHTPNGGLVMENFAGSICGSAKCWTDKNDIENAVNEIKKEVGNKNVGVLTSFGVDSSVAAKLTHMAYGDSALILYVSGLDRKGDSERAKKLAKKMGIENLVIIDAQDTFVEAVQTLPDPTDPQAKRRIIGDRYIDIFDSVARQKGWDPDKTYLVQGTLYTDWIESGGGVGNKAANIKAHHNVDSERIRSKKKKRLVLEPNKWKYKDGSRRRARALGLPNEIINAEPFPGPGLAVRMINGVSVPDNVEEIYNEINKYAKPHGLNGYIVPIRTVGVEGDERVYLNLAVLTGNSDFETRRKTSIEIVKKVRGIGRVAFSFYEPDQDDLLHIQPMEFNKENLNLLREIDYFVRQKVYKAIEGISQMPVILFPGPENPWVGIRPVSTIRYMTAAPVELPDKFAHELSDRIMSEFGLGGVVFDDTDKPPGTIEWE